MNEDFGVVQSLANVEISSGEDWGTGNIERAKGDRDPLTIDSNSEWEAICELRRPIMLAEPCGKELDRTEYNGTATAAATSMKTPMRTRD